MRWRVPIVEHRLYMIRAVHRPVGAHRRAVRVRLSGPPWTGYILSPSLSLMAEAALLDRGGLYVHVGDSFAYACLAVLAWLALAARVPKRRPRSPSRAGVNLPARAYGRKKNG